MDPLHSEVSDQLEAAVITLAGHGALKDRLCTAFCDHLDDVDADDLPEELQRDFAELTKAMHKARALPGDSVIRASVRKFSSEEAQHFAMLIVRLFSAQVQSVATVQKLAPRTASTARAATPLPALLALDGGNNSHPQPRHASNP
jgi:hypothetical protein